MDIREFLEARLAEDEAMAREACDGDSGRWFMGDKWNVYRAEDEAPEEDFEENKLVTWGNVKAQSEHIARHDPARVLRDVEAARTILLTYQWQLDHPDTGVGEEPLTARERIGREYTVRLLRNTVELLAAVYADHPDYREEWRP